MSSGICLFIAPLDKRINEEFLKSKFEQYGELLRTSIVKDENGSSKGYGFIHFYSVEDGMRAMEEMKGKRLLGTVVNIQISNNLPENLKPNKKSSSVNLFVAPLNKRVNDFLLKAEFEKFGELINVAVAQDENGDSKGYGFVHFHSEEDGLRAMKEMNGRMFFGTPMSVNLANKQNEEGRAFRDNGNSIWAAELSHDSLTRLERAASPTDYADSVTDVQSQFSDDQNSSEKWDVKERMKRLFENQSYTDVTFYPKSKSKSSISAHRAVLAIASPLFAKMLFGDSKSDTSGMKMEVIINNLPFEAFTNIIKYIYTDEVFFESEYLVQGILDGAKHFKIKSLISRCKQYFESLQLNEQNVCSKLDMSISYKIEVLKERCLDFIQKNTLQVINSPDFLKCSHSTMRNICKLQSFTLESEMELLNAVMSWLYAQPPQERNQLLPPLLKCIRFLNFSVSDFGDAIKKYPTLLTSEEGLNIMLFLYNPPKNPDFKKLPSWCNKSRMNRCFGTGNPAESKDIKNNVPSGKVLFPLKSADSNVFVAELTSLLQLKCIMGYHAINAIKLTFVKPKSDSCVINSLSIKVHCHPSGFNLCENVQIVNSESVRVEFGRPILARRGDLIDIEAEAKNVSHYNFLQFDESAKMPSNPHFECCVSSRPRHGKFYFISEIEYGPQARGALPPERRRRAYAGRRDPSAHRNMRGNKK